MTITSTSSRIILNAMTTRSVISTTMSFGSIIKNTIYTSSTLIRFKSTILLSSSPEMVANSSIATNQCPHHKSSSSSKKKQAIMMTKDNKEATVPAVGELQELFHVPKLPFVGSMIPQYSGTTLLELTTAYDNWYSLYKKFGKFYNIGFPSLGKGIYGDVYVLTDPNEYVKVLRKEGPHPYGLVSIQWPFVSYYQDLQQKHKKSISNIAADNDATGFAYLDVGLALFSNGKQWQKPRRFMQTDLLHPKAAKGYIPGMIKACQIASLGAPNHSKTINDYTAYCSFDMFQSIMFGEFPGLALSTFSSSSSSKSCSSSSYDESTKTSNRQDEKENMIFCHSTLDFTGVVVPLILNPMELVKNKIGIKTKLYSTFEDNFNISRDIALKKLRLFQDRKKNNELDNDFQKLSYASLATDRCLDASANNNNGTNGDNNDDNNSLLQKEDVAELIVVALIAGLDTTSSVLNWSITHLAMYPHVQDELYKEMKGNGLNDDGKLTEEYFTKSKNTKYLDAILRENHRMTPPLSANLMKENVIGDVVIHGKTIVKGSMFRLDTRSIGMDPTYVEAPDTFDPSRWLDPSHDKGETTINNDDVNGTKQTKKLLDHPLYREPFSAGARKCPGSRVATYKAKILLSQLVLDWKFSLASTPGNNNITNWRDIPYKKGTTIQPEVPHLSFEKR